VGLRQEGSKTLQRAMEKKKKRERETEGKQEKKGQKR